MRHEDVFLVDPVIVDLRRRVHEKPDPGRGPPVSRAVLRALVRHVRGDPDDSRHARPWPASSAAV